MDTDLEHCDAYDELDHDLPDGWYLLSKEDYGEQVFFCQHEETLQSTQTHEDPADAVREARATVTADTTAPEEGAIQRSGSPPASPMLPENDVEVFDADTGDMVKRSPHQQRKAMHLMRAIQMSTMVQAVALARMDEGKHYLDLGHSSYKEFADAELPFSYRHSKRLLRIGRRFQGLLPEADASEEATREALEAEIEESEEVRPFAAMGVSKLREITKLEDEDVEALASGKTLQDPETGDTYTLEDLKEMAAKDVKESVEAVRREKEAYQAKAQRQEETIKRLESEQEAMEEEVEAAQEKKEEALELEAQYGPKAQTYEDNKKALSGTRDLLFEVRESLFRADLDAESADGLKNQLLEIVRELNAIHADARARFAEALNTAEDTIAMEDDGWEPPSDLMQEVADANADNGTS